jgi:transcriptional regulator with XRE-family HTH domain
VRDRRLTLNLTQAELADLAGLSRTTVHHIESGAANVRFDAVLAVADVLGCDLRLTPRYAS